jgi:hypothetical protein
MNIKTEVFDEILTQAFSWEQAKPNQPKHPQSFPGYLGFLSFYDKGKSRQMLLSEEDFAICKTEKCDRVKAGRLILALEPIFKEISAKSEEQFKPLNFSCLVISNYRKIPLQKYASKYI